MISHMSNVYQHDDTIDLMTAFNLVPIIKKTLTFLREDNSI